MPSDLDLDELPPHLGLLAIATYIKQNGYNPVIFDSRKYMKNNFWPELKPLLKNALCVSISVMTAQVGSALKISQKIKEYNSNILVVWGGYHPSLFPEQTLKDPLVDFVIQGEGDWSFLDLIKSIETKSSYEHIDGFGYKKNNQLIFNPQSKFYDFNELPAWDWSFYDVERFIKGRTWSSPVEVRQLPVQSSRGCPYQCTFCINTILNCYKKWRAKDIDKVLDEVEDLIKNYNVQWIKFRDEIFFLQKKRIIDFCDEIIKRKIKFQWSANSRVDFFNNGVVDDEVLLKLKKAGCVNLNFGIESGSQRILNLLRKQITPAQAIKSAEMCNKYGLKPVYSFIVGIPSETKKDLMLTYNLMKKLVKLCPDSVLLGPHLYRPYPGCELYNIAKKFGVPEAKELREWPEIIEKSFKESSDPIERGGYSFDSMPWVDDVRFVKTFITYARYAASNPFHLLITKRYFMALQSIISKIRFYLRFYYWIGIERKIKDYVIR